MTERTIYLNQHVNRLGFSQQHLNRVLDGIGRPIILYLYETFRQHGPTFLLPTYKAIHLDLSRKHGIEINLTTLHHRIRKLKALQFIELTTTKGSLKGRPQARRLTQITLPEPFFILYREALEGTIFWKALTQSPGSTP